MSADQAPAAALAATCKGGRVVLTGIQSDSLPLSGVAIQRGQRSVIGTLMYEREDFRSAMRLLADDAFAPLARFIRRESLQDAPGLLADLAAGRADALKV